MSAVSGSYFQLASPGGPLRSPTRLIGTCCLGQGEPAAAADLVRRLDDGDDDRTALFVGDEDRLEGEGGVVVDRRVTHSQPGDQLI